MEKGECKQRYQRRVKQEKETMIVKDTVCYFFKILITMVLKRSSILSFSTGQSV